MHYANGREARLGDPVVGNGYNLKGTIVGIVVGLVPNQDSCNIRIAAVQYHGAQANNGQFAFYYDETHVGYNVAPADKPTYTGLTLEYGATKDFVHAEDAAKAVSDYYSTSPGSALYAWNPESGLLPKIVIPPTPAPAQPPVSNEFVEPGCEKFSAGVPSTTLPPFAG